MEYGRESSNHLSDILSCLESEYQRLKIELKQQESLTQNLYDQAKSQRVSVYKRVHNLENSEKTELFEAVKRNHQRIKALEKALVEKNLYSEQLGKEREQNAGKLTSKLDDSLAMVKQRREKLHSKMLQVEASRQRSLNRIKEAITDHQAKSMLNKSLSSFRSQSNLSGSRVTTSLTKSTVSKKNKFKVVTKSQMIHEQLPEAATFKKPKDGGYKRLKLFDYDYTKKSDEESNN